MPRPSLPSLRAQIAKLEQKAAAIKRQVVTRLQREIKAHGLTAEDLFGAQSDARRAVGAKRTARPTGAGKAKREPKYGDGAGNVWGGMGKRPQWLKDRLDAGAKLEDFLLGGQRTQASEQTAVPSGDATGSTRRRSKRTSGSKPAAKAKATAGRKASRARTAAAKA